MTGPPYRPPTPAADRLVAWPAAFGTRFTIFVDVEEEFDWSAPLSRAARSTTALAAFPAAHRRFAGHGAGLTCMVDYPAATDPRAADLIGPALLDGRSEVGSQLHPWVNPPFTSDAATANGYAGNLPVEAEAAKLDALTDAVAATFGCRPRIYRAGRYGLGPSTLRLLRERGYVADSSVRSRYDYRADGGPDFRTIGPAAYRTNDGIVELPLTTVFTGVARLGGEPLHRLLGRVPRGRGAAARLGLARRIALTPEDMPLADALAAVDVALADDLRLLVFSFHSPSLMPGHTPYVRDAADLRGFWRWWDAVLDRLDRRGVRPASLTEILAAAGTP